MKRGGNLSRTTPLVARTPLRSTTPLPRGVPLARTVPVLAGSKSAARKKAARDTGPDRKTRKLVLERDGYACVCCGASVIRQPYSLQHRKRRSQGGGNSPSNLITVLGTGTTGHHARIDSRIDPSDEAKGYTVRSWDDPAQVPVMVFSEHGSGASAWLWDDGTYNFDGPQEAAA